MSIVYGRTGNLSDRRGIQITKQNNTINEEERDIEVSNIVVYHQLSLSSKYSPTDPYQNDYHQPCQLFPETDWYGRDSLL